MEHYVVAVAPKGLKPLIELLVAEKGHDASLAGHDLIGGAVGHPADGAVLGGGGDGFGHGPQAVRAPIGPLEIILQHGGVSLG